MNRSLQLAQKQKAPPLPREYPQVRCGELPLQLQGRARVRYRNIWIRRLKPYDQRAKIN